MIDRQRELEQVHLEIEDLFRSRLVQIEANYIHRRIMRRGFAMVAAIAAVVILIGRVT